MPNETTDITLVNPVMRDCFPIGLGQIAAYLRDQGLSVEVVDASPQKSSPLAVVDQVLATRPRVVGLTGLWIHYPFIKEVSLGLSSRNKNLTQIGGGYWCVGAPDIAIKNTGVSVIVHGEGEKTSAQLIRAIIEKKDLSHIAGISYQRDGAFIQSNKRSLIKDLNKLPLPAYDLFDMGYYIRKWKINDFIAHSYLSKKDVFRRLGSKDIIRESTLFTSRGCFGKCAFCSAPAFGIRFRHYDTAYIIDHIQFLKNKYKADVFEITESLTFINKKQVRILCEGIIRSGLSSLFIATVRGDLELDRETAQMMREAGFYRLRIGYESANEYILNEIMGKHIPIEKYYENTAILREAGIRIEGTFILNMPGESQASIRDTYDFVRKSGLDYGYVFYANPLPGTRLFDYAEKNGFIKSREAIYEQNPGRDKGRSDFDRYIRHFDFNRLNRRILTGYRDMIEGMIKINEKREKKKHLRALISYILIHIVKVPLYFPSLKHAFPVFYDYFILGNRRISIKKVLNRVAKGLRLRRPFINPSK